MTALRFHFGRGARTIDHMPKAMWWVVAVLIAAGAAAILYLQPKEPKSIPLPASPPPVAQAPAPQPGIEPEIRYPIMPEDKPLPPLNESDATVREALLGLLAEPALTELLNLNEFVRRVVATIDNLPRRKVALRLMPVKPTAGHFVTAGKGDTLVIGPDNYARYSHYARMLDAVDTQKLVAVYTRLYPLFQQAYRDLGYPKEYFNDRLVEVIDVLLAAPEVQAPVKLVRPKVYYLFADPELETLPAGQKILIRIGPANAAKTKAKLREIRAELVSRAPKP